MFPKINNENGQALLLISVGLMVLLGLIGLAIDGGMAFADRRHGQNAADAAALYAARIYAESLTATSGATQTQVRIQVQSNGYTHDGVNTVVTLVESDAPGLCPDEEDGKDFTVTINTTVNTAFARLFGVNTIDNTVSATSRGCKSHLAPMFYGNAVVGLDPEGDSFAFDAWGSSDWVVRGGGVFSNSNAKGKGDNVTFPDGHCVTSVKAATGFPCDPNQNNPSVRIKYPSDVSRLLPANPCISGGTGIQAGSAPKKGETATFSYGIYCVSDLDSYSGVDIVLDHATLYITDPVFDLKFAGKGGFSGTATIGGDFDGYYLVVPLKDPPCTNFTDKKSQVIEFRGNGTSDLTGTVMAPSACVDFRGNSNGKHVNSQLIGYKVTSNGTGSLEINYNADDNHKDPALPSLQLIK